MTKENRYHISVLLAAWGAEFIDEFLQFGLPSLLAQGNIPALAKRAQVRFVVLTRHCHRGQFEDHAGFQRLASYCHVEFMPIDDLVLSQNHSTTLTLAYDRAIKRTGEAMLKTHFILLNSDYVMASTSFEGLLRYMDRGYSAICAGNFQITAEEVKPYFIKHFDPQTHTISIPPRELLAYSFKHLHPIVTAGIFNLNMTHNYRANRFFYRYNSDIMAGRFYLIHPICIKPETMDYRVGSSFDYSFVSEMCPSGNIGVMNDSDDYLVIEIQPKDHELDYVQLGKYDRAKLARGLAEWTTRQHRKNCQHSIYFHTRDLLPREKAFIESELETFVEEVSIHLNRYKVQPHDNHPYWLGATSGIHDPAKQSSSQQASPTIEKDSLLKRAYEGLFGTPPNVYFWHYRYHEFHSVKQLLRSQLNKGDAQHDVVFYDSHDTHLMNLCHWLGSTLGITKHYFLMDSIEIRALAAQQFDRAILLTTLSGFHSILATLATIKDKLKPDSEIIVLIANHKNSLSSDQHFQKSFLTKANALLDSDYRIADIDTVHNHFTYLGLAAFHHLRKKMNIGRKSKISLAGLGVAIGFPLVLLNNCLGKIRPKKKGHCTHLMLSLVPVDK